jgi:hypothetical protein
MNKELSTGLYPVKEPTQQELEARRDLSNKMETFYGEPAVASRLAAVEAEAENLRRMREQPIDSPKQSPEIQAHIDKTYQEALRKLWPGPETA